MNSTDHAILGRADAPVQVAPALTLFQLLGMLDPVVRPEHCKLHFAVHNGHEHPLDVYLTGRFDEWQRFQNKLSFHLPFVVSLVAMPQRHQWLFAGVHRSGPPSGKSKAGYYRYPLTELESCSNLNGRLVVRFEKTFRASYPYARKVANQLLVSELRAERITIAAFPGYRHVDLSREELLLIHREQIPAWHSALSSVAGVYLITDTLEGKLYVGSAVGQGGIWQRWSDYARTAHGGNVELRRLLQQAGPDRARHLRYAILEIADIHDEEAAVLRRESHWKKILLTRECGLNAN
jgi:hypothetical protein